MAKEKNKGRFQVRYNDEVDKWVVVDTARSNRVTSTHSSKQAAVMQCYHLQEAATPARGIATAV